MLWYVVYSFHFWEFVFLVLYPIFFNSQFEIFWSVGQVGNDWMEPRKQIIRTITPNDWQSEL